MRLADMNDASRLATKLTRLKDRRGEWAKVGLTGSAVARRINANGSSPDRLPDIDDDTGMHVALIEAVIAEYDKRIVAAETDLKDLGVTL